MKRLATILSLAVATLALSQCANSEGDPNAPASYNNPSPLETQARIQQMHSDALRQEF
ncbi:MAG: hypothetical protein KDM63_01710 [Verrucomicrobiae bacterium]|nr:hypothetical protein [Verrucomicrobiae bacterium]